jgi:hypothetical protein
MSKRSTTRFLLFLLHGQEAKTRMKASLNAVVSEEVARQIFITQDQESSM